MKKFLIPLLCCVLIFVIFGATACVTPETTQPSQDNDDKNQEINLSNINLGYMSDLMVNLKGNTALGIKKSKIQNNEKSISSKNRSVVKLVSAPLSDSADEENDDDQFIEKYYLYTTTQTYSNGVIEYDNNTIEKVTFRKNTQTMEDIYDSEGNLIDSNTTITQDDLGAQINKLYVTKEYTFVQFVALVESSGQYDYYDENGEINAEYIELRPSGLTYDENGVAEFDKSNYYSSALSQSFVIDNNTGYIYKIENLTISGFKNGLITIEGNNGYFNLSIQDNNLNISDVLPNKDVKVYNVYKDLYGWTFVANDKINDTDNERKIIYTTETRAKLISSEGVVYTVEEEAFGRFEDVKYYENGALKQYEYDKIIPDLTYLYANHHGDYDYRYAFYYEKLIYKYSAEMHCGENKMFKEFKDEQHYWSVVEVKMLTEKHDCYGWLDTQFDYFYCVNNAKQLSYVKVDLTKDFTGGKEYTDDELTSITDKEMFREKNYYLSVGNDKYKLNNVFYFVGINGTTYYQLVRGENGLELKELKSINYDGNTFILQPINN